MEARKCLKVPDPNELHRQSPGPYALYRTEFAFSITYPVSIEREIGMELFFMMTAMLTLLGPIAVGRVRCIGITPRLLDPVQVRQPAVASASKGGRESGRRLSAPYPARLARLAAARST